jgi:hypothetical protein
MSAAHLQLLVKLQVQCQSWSDLLQWPTSHPCLAPQSILTPRMHTQSSPAATFNAGFNPPLLQLSMPVSILPYCNFESSPAATFNAGFNPGFQSGTAGAGEHAV